MQSVTRTGTARTCPDRPIHGHGPTHSLLAGGSRVARGLRKTRSAALAAVALSASLFASLGATQGAWAADGQSSPAPAATPAPAPAPTVPVGPPITAVRVTTNMGVFVVELNAERAPLTVQNFLRYVNEGFYTNTLFHRVVGNFVVQGGGYDATSLKLKPTHEYVFNESGNGLQNKRGSVGMARSGPPHSANSQFYVNLADNSELDPLATRWGYAVFGQVIEGMEVVEKMGVIATGSVGPFKSEAPLKSLVIQKVEPLTNASTSTVAPAAAPTPPPPPAPSGEGATPPPQ
jgi:cyclophilin family peptidyl-prolyl cis-trans isomerase